MKLNIAQNEQKISQLVADEIENLIKRKPDAVLGLATGSTPIPVYQELIRRHQAGRIDFSQVRTFNLDEYYGLDRSHDQSYYQFMQTHLFSHINIQEDNIHIPSGQPADVEAYCREYEAEMERAGGVDLQLLGIGHNGHIGFNEPAKELHPGTHLVRLKPTTIEANARFFTSIEQVPTQAITMGMQNILKAKRILLLATGRDKAEIIHKLIHTGITTDIPASFLKLHDNVGIFVDEEAGSLVASCATS
ncbi:glucosamine-6-phosphate deaminase [Brevibacillus dissolubilis]|uniref:glucosamine-6-phosphate deaminase n=1 Tax=Brevibacillus dissolubilis TaxID=1844116 RepID=UPI001115C29A|nr:glucosamine-6-phosphate deaminase [Brevibacillus dissolubilis]